MSVFADEYSAYYNLLYKDKNYSKEAGYVLDLVQRLQVKNSKTILDVGCGTAKHAHCFFEKGFVTSGVDQSAEMIAIAKKNYPHVEMQQGVASSFKFNKKFDVITSLFHVASYQTQDEELKSYFGNISQHLEKDGLFIFDFWYGPAVLFDPPQIRIKRLEDDSIRVVRLTEPALYVNDNCVDVNFQVFVTNKNTEAITQIQEVHKMRYLFIKEVESLMAAAGMELVHNEEWISGKPLSEATWYACCVGRKL